MRGSASIVAWSCGTLQSRTRSGFVSARRWQSPHIDGATERSRSRSVSTYAGRQLRSPTELRTSSCRLTPQASRYARASSTTSASIVGLVKPKASTSTWWNCR